jgi:hypothetical protein
MQRWWAPEKWTGQGRLPVARSLILPRQRPILLLAATWRRSFHKADCKSAAKIVAKNLVRYNTREEAIQAGKNVCGVQAVVIVFSTTALKC